MTDRSLEIWLDLHMAPGGTTQVSSCLFCVNFSSSRDPDDSLVDPSLITPIESSHLSFPLWFHRGRVSGDRRQWPDFGWTDGLVLYLSSRRLTTGFPACSRPARSIHVHSQSRAVHLSRIKSRARERYVSDHHRCRPSKLRYTGKYSLYLMHLLSAEQPTPDETKLRK